MAEQAGAGGDSTAPDAGISIGDYVSDVFGDTTEGDESQPAATSDAAGTPPAERQETAGEVETAPEGDSKAERAGTTPADAAGTAPDKGTPTTEADSDPLATATPFTYSVNGQDKPFDGIKVLGDAGAIITSDALPLLAQKLSDAERFHTTSREQYDQIRNYEKLSEWKTTLEDGKEATLTGRDGLVAMRSDFESLKAAFDTFVQVLKPAADGSYPLLSALVDVDPKTNQIIANPAFVGQLLERSNNAEFRARISVRDRLAAISTATPTTSGPQATTLDYSTVAPQIIEQAAKETGIDSKLLNEKDRSFLAQQLPRYLRTVTEADRAENYALKVGAPIVDGAFTQVVKDRAELRREIGAQAQAATSAAKENAAKLAAAAVGQRTPVTPSTSRTTQPTPASTRVSDADAAWALRERLSSGKFSST